MNPTRERALSPYLTSYGKLFRSYGTGVMRYIAALFIIAGLLGCLSLAPPTDEEIARNRAEWETQLAVGRARGRALWERALTQWGDSTYTVHFRTGARDVVRDVELEENRYCRILLAERGTARHNDYWRNYDDLNQLQRRCALYGDFARIVPGDERPDR